MKYETKKKQLNSLRSHRFTDGMSVTAENRLYYYIWGIYNGKRICLGPYQSEEEAWNMTYQKGIDGDVYGLRTRDQAAATRILKAKSLNNDDTTLDTAIQRVRHKGKDIDID